MSLELPFIPPQCCPMPIPITWAGPGMLPLPPSAAQMCSAAMAQPPWQAHGRENSLALSSIIPNLGKPLGAKFGSDHPKLSGQTAAGLLPLLLCRQFHRQERHFFHLNGCAKWLLLQIPVSLYKSSSSSSSSGNSNLSNSGGTNDPQIIVSSRNKIKQQYVERPHA